MIILSESLANNICVLQERPDTQHAFIIASSVIGPDLIIYAAVAGAVRMLRARESARARTREATAEPAAGACGMRGK